MLYSHKTSPAAEYEWPLTQCTTASAMRLSAGMVWKWRFAVGGWKYHQTASVVKSTVPLLTNCRLLGNGNLYLSTALYIRLNSSKIHSSNNNVAVCAAPSYHYTLSSFWYSMPISIHSLAFNTFSALSISHAAYSALTPLAMLELSGSKIQFKDHKDLSDLPLIPLLIVFFHKILNSSKLWNNFM